MNGERESPGARASAAFLDEARQLSDPLADDVVESLAGSAPAAGEADSLAVLARVCGDPAAPGASRAACERFLRATCTPPGWFDPVRIEQGQRIFVRHSVLSITALLLGGLVDSYANVHIARLLAGTGRITQDTGRRLFETAQMVHDVMLPGSLDAGGAGRLCLLRVRLVHAGVRRKVLGSGRWDASWGLPINQEDMLFTLLTLSLSVLQGLQKLGVRLRADDREAYHHLWRCAGWILGVDERLLPTSEAEARALYAEVARRHCHPGESSRALARSILDHMAGRPPLFLPRAALAELSRLMLDDPRADAMELPRSAAWSGALACLCPAISLLTWVQRRGPLLEGVSLAWGWRYAQWNLRHGLNGRPADFRIPGVVEGPP